MTAKVVTVTSGKGGVGKTTTTANLAVALASHGDKVVCIDSDIALHPAARRSPASTVISACVTWM